eukprot:snap_masked-scaffold_23-processed-gene-3.14-mRNA-1 protein AED:1.00 eAED:1.00 QI:0/0/0/0/1/1/2/0/59
MHTGIVTLFIPSSFKGRKRAAFKDSPDERFPKRDELWKKGVIISDSPRKKEENEGIVGK